MGDATKKLEVILNYTDGLSGKSGRTIKSLGGIERGATRAATAVERVNKALGRNVKAGGIENYGRRLGKLRGELRASLKDAELVRNSLGSGFDLKGIEAAITKTREYHRTAGRTLALPSRSPSRRAGYQPGAWMRDSDSPPDWRRELRGQQGPPAARRSGPGRLERYGNRARALREVGDDFGAAYNQAREGVEKYTDPASELMRTRARLGALGLSGGDAARAEDAVRAVVAGVKGARLAEVTQAFAELYEVFGSVEDTARNLPRAARYSFALKTLHGDRYSGGQLIEQTKSAYKFIDLLGLTRPDAQGRVDHGRADAYHDQLLQVLSATGGDVDPREMQQMAKIGGTSLLGMNRAGLTHMAALASDVGGSRAGNLQRSLFQSFVGGKLFPRHIKRLAELGMLDESKVLKKTGGKFELMPGAIRDAHTISTDPLVFVDTFAKALSAKGVDTTDESQVVNAVAGVTGNTLSQQMLAQMIIRRGEITRFDEIVARAESLDKLYGRAEGMPLGNIEDARAKQENLRATAGGPLLEAGGSLSSRLSAVYADLQSFAEGRPVMAAALAGIGALGKGSLHVGEGLGTVAGLLRELRGGGGGVGLLDGGYDVGDVATGGYMGLRTLQNLRGILAALKSPVPIAIGLTAASAFTISQITELYQLMEEKRRADAAAAAANAGNLGAIGRARSEFGRMGQPVPGEVWRAQAGGALAKLNGGGELKDALGGWTPGSALNAGLRVWGLFNGARPLFADTNPYSGARRFEPGAAARAFRDRAPELREPEVMGEFRRMLDSWRLPPESRAKVDEALKAAFPESFSKASQMAAEELSKLQPAASSTGEALKKLYDPTFGLASGMNEALAAALGFASRVNGLEIRPPSIIIGGESGGRTKSGYKLGIDPLNPFGPPSAVGSIVERDGLVSAHRGNVIFPASLSRRTPGDWLDTADALRGEGAGRADYSLFAGRGAGAPIQISFGDINVGGGADAASAGAAVAAEVERRLREVVSRLAAVEGDLYDPRFLAEMSEHQAGKWRDRT